ncbi:MAG: caspase family protein, partial [Paramuribaculum sp.]|nr:caspase family protein [Paramuribaculum sp.]
MKNVFKIQTTILLLFLLPISAVAEKYEIMRLTTPTINVGGKPKKKGDIIEDTKAIGWIDNNQSVEVKNMSTGALHRFSKKVFESHGGIVSIKDYFISINKASTRDGASDIIVSQSTAKEKFPERRLALVIGNSNYNNLSYLRNAQKDASDVANTLLELGFDVIESYECSSTQLRTALNRFASMSDNYDMALFYYAGHGLQEKGKNYLVPIESKLEYLSELDRMLNCDDVVQRMESSKAKSRLIVLDACRNAKKSWTRDITEGLARMEGGAGSVILFSTQSGK